MIDFWRTLLSSAFVFGVLVFIHELGHYLAARKAGVKIEAFSLGFGPVIHKWVDKLGTEWRLSVLPLGGYVRMHGFDDPKNLTDEERAALIPHEAFHFKPLGWRIAVVAMGPIFNFLLAIFLFALIFFFWGKPVIQPEIAQIVAGGSAEKAGLKVGDVITGVVGEKIEGAEPLRRFFQTHPDTAINLEISRDKAETVVPVAIQGIGEGDKKSGLLGVGFAVKSVPQHNPLSDLKDGCVAVWDVSEQIVVGVWQIISGQRSAKELGGTIRIVQMSGQVAKHGWESVLNFMAVLSVNLGILNLFPIPALDGGRLVFYFAEGIMRRPVPDRIQQIALRVGVALILTLFLFSTFNDLNSVGLFHWFSGLFGK